jgi:plastocyanin
MRKLLHLAKWSGLLAAAIAILALAACSSPSATTSAPASSTAPSSAPPATTSSVPASTPAGQAVTIAITAKSISFDKSSITVPAGAKVTVNFNNADSGIPHNFAVYTDSGANTSIFVGQVITGPATVSYQFTAPAKAGTYFFRCDIHPSIMTGSFIVQ